jgi:hypothetical protein
LFLHLLSLFFFLFLLFLLLLSFVRMHIYT